MAVSQQRCARPGCTKPVFVEGNGRVHDYCGRTHAEEAEEEKAQALAQMVHHHNPPGPFNPATSFPVLFAPRIPILQPPQPPDAMNGFQGRVPRNCQQSLCSLIGCGQPVSPGVDPRTGQAFEYCSRSHALQAQSSQAVCQLVGCGQPVSPGVDPRTGQAFEYCSRSHALQAQSSQAVCQLVGCGQPVSPGVDPGTGQAFEYCSRSHALQAQSSQAVCQLVGCGQPVSPGVDRRTGQAFRFCSRSHCQQAQVIPPPGGNQQLPQCKNPGCSNPVHVERGHVHNFCRKACAVAFDRVDVDHVWEGNGPNSCQLFLLSPQHAKRSSVINQFMQAWKTDPKPKVVRVIQVRNPKTVYTAYKNYVASLPTPNEERRFHGTRMHPSCSFGIDPSEDACGLTGSCALCCICASSFNIGLSGTGPLHNNAVARQLGRGGRRYGSGLYFSKHSNKSHDYAGDTERMFNGERHRLMLLCKVAEGKRHMMSQQQMDEAEVHQLLSRGQYDSVVAEGQGVGPLNFHEVVVYKEMAALPSYIIVYKQL